MKIYIYILYEIHILQTSYLQHAINVIYSITTLVVFKDSILAFNMLECILFVIISTTIICLVWVILLLPFALYIPGDNSYIEKILKSSLHGQLLIEYKKNLLKNVCK